MDLKQLVESNDVAQLKKLLEAGEIFKVGDKLLTKTDHEAYQEERAQEEYFDMLQGVRKVLLNSSYGATLNEFCRFHDPRLGASTTGSGRQITAHMIETIATSLIGENAPKLKKETIESDGKTIKSGSDAGGDWVREVENFYTIDCPTDLGPIYSDTDSCYFVMERFANNVDDAVACADAVVANVNEAFPIFMKQAFNCQPGFEDKIQANRELVCHSGLYRMKKKYLLYVADKEGKRIPVDSEKALYTKGSDIAISSTPEIIKKMLKDVTMMVLRGEPKTKIDDYIITFRRTLKNGEAIAKGVNILDFATIVSIKTYDEYFMKWERIEKPGLGKVKPPIPMAVRSAINYNEFLKAIGDGNTAKLIAGMKVKVVWLKSNEFGFETMAFSSDTEHLPDWFVDHFEVDISATEAKMIDSKLEKIFEPLGWMIPTEQTVKVGKLLTFDE